MWEEFDGRRARREWGDGWKLDDDDEEQENARTSDKREAG